MRLPRLLPSLLALTACAGTVTAPARPDHEEPAPEPAGPTHSDGPDPAPQVGEHEVRGYGGDPSAELFDDAVLHAIDITLPEASVAALEAQPYEWAIGSVTVDGVHVEDIGVRLRGKIGSFRDLSGKPKLGLDFNQFVADRELFGVESLNLNNSIVDCSFLRDKLGYRIYAEAGLPETRVAFAEVSVNGAPYGLYQMVEAIDDEWLERAWPDPTGNLYDGKYVWFGGWDYVLLDFDSAVHHGYALEEGVDVGSADIFAVTAALDAHAGQPDFYAAVEPIVDWPHFHAYFAAEQWTEQWDGYAGNQNNNFVYFDPAAGGRMKLVTTDLDYAFPVWTSLDWKAPVGRLVHLCFADPACRAAHQAAVDDFLDNLDTAALAADFEAWDTLTRDAALADPRHECSAASIGSERGLLRGWITSRDATMRAFWGL